MRLFRAPDASLGRLDAAEAASLFAQASDIALVIDTHGVIRDLAIASEDLSRDLGAGADWHGRPWLDTVTADSRPKVEALVQGIAQRQSPRWRHVNQVASPDGTVPILYSAMRIGEADRAMVFGRDLRPMSQLQQRLLEAQHSAEREYGRLRQAETRYRLLFQLSPEPVLIADAPSGRVLEMNPAAQQLLGRAAKHLPGRPVTELFDRHGQQAVRALLVVASGGSGAEEATAVLAEGARPVRIAASLLREGGGAAFLLRLSPVQAPDRPAMPPAAATLLTVVQRAPDAFVVTDDRGRILTANEAFLELAQLATEEDATGELLDRWLGGLGAEMEVLVTALRERGSVRLFAAALRGEQGASTEVEVSAVSVLDSGKRPSFGFAIRNLGARARPEEAGREPLRSVDEIKELIGRVPLKQLVQEAATIIERLCIEAALRLTGDNRARAAEMLGLSRQSLYDKLHRYGLGNLDAKGGEGG
ncbi:transcriptional regulator PpsR [Belnapia rosea]|uniref:Transcriptional regulator PpsR n=1 Tax=Belnapia rosea TaxID=938405 RepID=A0A1G6QSK1_9PROT|nr:transcriptional regulator PpsR [Belnapia rosea]SDC95342.1 transcriptional regulator PpsR [Belnapia rosea]